LDSEVYFSVREDVVPNATKHDLIVDVSKSTGLTQADTKIVIEELLGIIAEILEKGNSIEIRGFGTFYTKIRKPRPARNPKTGEVVPLLKRIVPLFKYSTEFKTSITAALTGAAPAAGTPIGAGQ
jgi:integration host factor subunit beta